MSSASADAGDMTSRLASVTETAPRIALRLVGLAVVDAFAIWFLLVLIQDAVWTLAAVMLLITLAVNIIFLRDEFYPLRWMSPGLAILVLMVIYPIIFTVYTAFTNYSDGHILTKQQAAQVIERSEQYLPEGATTYSWTAYRSEGGEFVLWLESAGGQTLLARPDETVREATPGEGVVGPSGEGGVPQSIAGYERLSRAETVRYLSDLDDVAFGEAPNTIRISSLNEAARYRQRYVYDESQDAFIDQSTGTVYEARPKEGAFVSPDGEVLRPGYRVVTGAANFSRLFNSPALRGPFIRVFLWTFAFATLSVVLTFSLGLFLALVFDDPMLPGRKLIRSLLIIPYAIPPVISVLMWRGLLNPHLGVISTTMQDILGWSPPWFSSPWWGKAGILFIQLWLGYPYMMLISTGALQAVPQDIYEAAQVDGAGAWQRFWNMTLPLLLISLGPLLVSSFAFNFNNFNVIYLYNEGGPPISGSPTPAGHTDILISYTFRLAFAGGRGADYAFAAAITIFIFLIVATITFFQFRYTRMWEEVGENV